MATWNFNFPFPLTDNKMWKFYTSLNFDVMERRAFKKLLSLFLDALLLEQPINKHEKTLRKFEENWFPICKMQIHSVRKWSRWQFEIRCFSIIWLNYLLNSRDLHLYPLPMSLRRLRFEFQTAEELNDISVFNFNDKVFFSLWKGKSWTRVVMKSLRERNCLKRQTFAKGQKYLKSFIHQLFFLPPFLNGTCLAPLCLINDHNFNWLKNFLVFWHFGIIIYEEKGSNAPQTFFVAQQTTSSLKLKSMRIISEKNLFAIFVTAFTDENPLRARKINEKGEERKIENIYFALWQNAFLSIPNQRALKVPNSNYTSAPGDACSKALQVFAKDSNNFSLNSR